ncbi:DUF6350 family protein [Rothia nasimurium]|uniref:cell division protein PerM n=1 Tax=Rothia nasimurium TaxID=85336 RepID=UPI001F2C80AE|nr:DUF6350 family protein [Rothia nasimurium]
MKTSARPHRTLPMPLWLQGTVELALVALASYLTVALILAAIWYTNGFNTANLAGAISVAGHLWLLVHGVPLHLEIPEQAGMAAISGTMSFVPLGLTLIPLALCYRAGRRLARASYEGQFWQPFAGGLAAYALVGAGISLLSAGEFLTTSPLLAALAPLWVAALGILAGGYAESRSLAAMIGVNAADWVKNFSQYSRWAGSYAWALVRSAVVGLLAYTAGGALLLAGSLFWHWDDVVALYQTLHAGAVGGAALTLLQLGLLVNLVVFAMSWSSGAGFALGEGTRVDLTGTEVGVMPSFPILGALPHATEPWGYAALAVPVLAGAVGGWWFFREGENHFDEWMSLKIRFRWISWPLSTLGYGVLTLVPVFLVTLVVGWMAGGSLGVGRFTSLGPDPLFFAVFSAFLLAVGAMLGLGAAHLLVRDTSGELERFADQPATRAERKAAREAARAEAQATRAARKAEKGQKAKKGKQAGAVADGTATDGSGAAETGLADDTAEGAPEPGTGHLSLVAEAGEDTPEADKEESLDSGDEATPAEGIAEGSTEEQVVADAEAAGQEADDEAPSTPAEDERAETPEGYLPEDSDQGAAGDEAAPSVPAQPFRPVVKRPKSLRARRQKRLEELADQAKEADRPHSDEA